MIKAVVFDLDGTLLNTIQDLANASNYALEQLGDPTFTTEEYKHLVGDGRRNLILRMLPEGQREDETMVARATELFDTYYQKHMRDCTAPYPGIPALLRDLKKNGLRLGVVSNKPHEFVTQIVEEYFPGIFDSVAGQQGTLVKPDPAALNRVIADFGLHPDEVLYVGDSNVDIYTAKNAKTASCGVLWGFRGEEELEEAGAEHLAAAEEDILSLVLSLNRAEGLRRGLALFSVILMLVGLAGLIYFLTIGNAAGVAACVALPLLAGFAAMRMTRREER